MADESASEQANVYIKAAAAIATATASGTVTVEDLKTAVDVLEDAQGRGASADEALDELEGRVPSVGDRLREALGKPVTWAVLNFVVQLIRLLREVT